MHYSELDGSPARALEFALELATRWGVVKIPPDVQVMVSGLVIERGKVVREGVVVAVPRADPEESQTVFADVEVRETNDVAEVADALIELVTRSTSA